METGYKTKTLNLAAFLYSKGLKLTDTVRINDEVFFVFSPLEEAEKLVDQYFSNTAVCNPKELFVRLNDLRDLLFSQGRKRRV